LRGGVVVKENQILLDYHPVRPKRRTPLLNKEGSFVGAALLLAQIFHCL